MQQAPSHPALSGLVFLQRSWLSSNQLLIPDEGGATVIDAGHVVDADQTLSLLHAALARVAAAAGESGAAAALKAAIATHLHSDHCGGLAAIRAEFGADCVVPASRFDAVRRWDDTALGYADIGQRCARYTAQAEVAPGTTLKLGGRDWTAIAAPGHDPDSLMLFDSTHGLLLSADALWENGFGVVFPELDGRDAFDLAGATLDAIARLPVSLVIPGHGAAFADVAAALERARRRLADWKANPQRHLRHASKVMLKYHLMEEKCEAVADLHAWAARAPLVRRMWERSSAQRIGKESLDDWLDALAVELAGQGVIRIADGTLFDAG